MLPETMAPIPDFFTQLLDFLATAPLHEITNAKYVRPSAGDSIRARREQPKPTEATCDNCLETKPIAEFYWDHSRYVPYNKCKICHNLPRKLKNEALKQQKQAEKLAAKVAKQPKQSKQSKQSNQERNSHAG